MGRLVVVAVLLLAAVAAADAGRRLGGGPVVAPPEPREVSPRPELAVGDPGGFRAVADGRLTRTRVLHGADEVLSREQIDRAFPVPFEEGGTFDIAHLALAPDGTLAVALHKFPAAGAVRSGIELWQGDELVAAFDVPPGSFAGGIGFSAGGELVVAFESGRREATLFERSGRWDAYVPLG
jgi:hypothetical protein